MFLNGHKKAKDVSIEDVKVKVNNEIREDEVIEDDFTNEISYDESSYKVTLSVDEKVKCLDEIIAKLKKILYVYDKSLEPNSTYNYKVYCGGILIYVSSSNFLFDGELVNIVINLNAILTNNFSKNQIKRITFETINFAQYISSKYKKELNKEVNKELSNKESYHNNEKE